MKKGGTEVKTKLLQWVTRSGYNDALRTLKIDEKMMKIVNNTTERKTNEREASVLIGILILLALEF